MGPQILMRVPDHIPQLARKSRCSKIEAGFSGSRTSGLQILMASPNHRIANERQMCNIPYVIEGAMDTATFVWYITEQLAPTLRPGQIVVLDNLSVHKAASIRQAIEARQCQLLFLPPYSPDFTPIEQAFSKLKAMLRRLGARTKEALWEAMQVAVEALTREDAIAWFAHAGYVLPAPVT